MMNTKDRFNSTNEALSFRANGYFKMPTGVYISGNYSLTAWVRVNTVIINELIIDIDIIMNIK